MNESFYLLVTHRLGTYIETIVGVGATEYMEVIVVAAEQGGMECRECTSVKLQMRL